MRWVLSIVLFSVCVSLCAQGRLLSDLEVKDAIIQENIARYAESCPCPYSLGVGCTAFNNMYTRSGGQQPICYHEQVTPSMVQEYRLRTETASLPTGIIVNRSLHPPGQMVGIVTEKVFHHPLSHVIVTSGVDPARWNFVFNGILYHPIITEGCDRILVGTQLTIVHASFAIKTRYSSSAVVFRLPDNSRCLAMSLGPTNF